MINFNGRIKITSCDSLDASGSFGIVANFSDNTAVFSAKDAIVGDIIYAMAENEAGDAAYHLYQITEIDASATEPNNLVATIKFFEDYEQSEEICTPLLEDEAMVCRVSSEQGFAMLATGVQKFTQHDIDSLRNINLARFDKEFTKYIKAYIDDKLKDFPSDNPTEENPKDKILLETDQHYLLIDDTGKKETFSGNLVNYSELISANNNIDISKTITSDGDIYETETYHATNIKNIENISSDSIIIEKNIGLAGSTNSVNERRMVNGATVNNTIKITGTDTAKLAIDVTATNEDAKSQIDINVDNLDITAEQVDMSSSTVKAMSLSLSAVNFEDNDAITLKYLKQYLSENSPADVTELEEKINNNTVNIESVQTLLTTFIDDTYNNDINNINEQLESLRDAIADTSGEIIPGTYTSVSVNQYGRVTSGETHNAPDIIGTSNPEFGLGDYSTDIDYSYIYAWNKKDDAPGSIPFIRYNFINKCWEFSNDGITIQHLGGSSSSEILSADMGLITEPAMRTVDLNEKTSIDNNGKVTQLADNIDLNNSDIF